MKLYARLENEKGKIDGLGGNEYLDIGITVGNIVLVNLTIRQNENGEYRLYDGNDNDITPRIIYNCVSCGEHCPPEKCFNYN